MLRLFLDEDSQPKGLLAALRHAGFDCLSVTEARRRGRPDYEQLEFATVEGRIVFTCNVGDFAKLDREWKRAGKPHAGIIVLTEQRLPIGSQVRAMRRLAAAVEASSMENQFEYLLNYL